MRAGDTFIRAGKHVKADPHLWVVVSEPSKDKSHLVIVNFISQRTDRDQSCVIQLGEHPFVTQETVVFYQDARVVPESAILNAVSAKLFVFKDPVSQPLLAKVRSGAAKSELPSAAYGSLTAASISLVVGRRKKTTAPTW